MYENFLSDRLAELRTQKGISARDMSLSLGQANNYINTIENRKSLPSMQSFFYICEFLKITPQEFFDVENTDPKMLRDIMDEAKKLDHTAQTHILGIMKELNRHK
ncbi:MAG: helix-turn-helix domain-containing protein [Bacteroidales bacterium]|nr:helix-turn-helix domain-containing protein [Bacteroidales bacterium]MCM1424541.1 helix-turn-helix domain-containing protein [bacterium]